MNRLTKMLGGVLLAGLVAACGGGGGSAGSTPGGGGGGGTGNPTDPVDPTNPTVPAVGSMRLVIANASGTEVSNIDGGGGYVARATLTNASGAAVTDRLVSFSLTDNAIATLQPATALTNASGVAQVSIAPSSLTAQGATTLTATAIIDATTLTATKDLAVSASDLSLGAISIGQTSLPSGGNTSLAVTALVDGTAASGTPVNVTFTASCGSINSLGGSVSVTTNGSGVASASYTAVEEDGSLCSGPVTVTAAAAGANGRSASIAVAAPTANAITFVGADPAQIFLAGTGALEQSEVTFKVLAGDAPLANQAVNFSLSVNPGGVGLNASGSTAPVSATTDANGDATVTIFSGSIPGPVRVRAALAADPSVFRESQNLTVASGPPSQRFMSLSVQTFNIEGANIDGTPTRLTVRLADRQGNAVEDGTVVNFTTEGGQVASSCATVQVSGISSCSVDFVSQNPRPTNGRVSVLAFTNGTKDYEDNNANNRFDAGDTLLDIGDAYRDDDEDAAFDATEFLVPRGGTRACAGAGAPFPRRANTCDAQLATTVRQQTTILFSSTNPSLTPVVVTRSEVEFLLGSDDYPLLPMPAGTTVAATPRDDTGTNGLTCSIVTIGGSTVPNVTPGTNPLADLRTRHSVALKDCAAGDDVLIDITAPSGLKTTFTIPIT